MNGAISPTLPIKISKYNRYHPRGVCSHCFTTDAHRRHTYHGIMMSGCKVIVRENDKDEEQWCEAVLKQRNGELWDIIYIDTGFVRKGVAEKDIIRVCHTHSRLQEVLDKLTQIEKRLDELDQRLSFPEDL